jgi:glycosyltransferase involved in cell wall biosynthesis
MIKPKLSILICTINSRKEQLNSLLSEISRQTSSTDCVQICINSDEKGGKPTGTKRNELLDNAEGDYVVFIDDDDHIMPNYVSAILKALKHEPDVVGFNGYMTTNGTNRENWSISKDLEYETILDSNGKKFYNRFNNHLSPIKAIIAKQIRFPDIFIGEDYQYAKKLKNSELIKTEVFIDEYLYHYDYKHVLPPKVNIPRRVYVRPKSRRHTS